MNSFKNIFAKLPEYMAKLLLSLPPEISENIEELRLKTGLPFLIYANGKEYVPDKSGVVIEKGELDNIFHGLLNYSIYAFQDEITKGYITAEGGHRVGICGRTVMEKGEIKTIKDISSLNIRRSREIIGVSDKCLPFILKNSGEVYNTLIVSPPKCGKTTLLRDIIRSLSHKGFKIGLCDERSEISGMYQGVPSFDLGSRTDILDGCPKDQGLVMLIRAMSPNVIATDEIGRRSDVEALDAALNAGISVVTTIHGRTYDDLINSGIGNLIKSGYFERIIYLTNNPRTGTLEKICGKSGGTI